MTVTSAATFTSAPIQLVGDQPSPESLTAVAPLPREAPAAIATRRPSCSCDLLAVDTRSPGALGDLPICDHAAIMTRQASPRNLSNDSASPPGATPTGSQMTAGLACRLGRSAAGRG